MELLDPDDREILVRRKWENLSFSEIGERLGISSEAARKRHDRAVGRLGEMIWALRFGKLEEVLEDSR
jgi:RNA polymerase sigma factor (sigma-70 family)